MKRGDALVPFRRARLTAAAASITDVGFGRMQFKRDTKSGRAIGRPKGADYHTVRETGASIGTTAAVRKAFVKEGAL